MNFRHPFELGLAQFSPILLFELSSGVLETRPEGNSALVPQDCDTLFSHTCTQDQLKPRYHQKEKKEKKRGHLDFSEYWKRTAAPLTYILYSFLSRCPICLPVFFKPAHARKRTERRPHTHTHTKTPTHTRLFAQRILVLADYPGKEEKEKREVSIKAS